jgi:D-alanine-D-alanine ligase-like ATP-grasp enzyme
VILCISYITQASNAFYASQRCRKHQWKIPQNTGLPTQKHLKYSRASRATQGCFDLFGVDVMVDSNGHPWLLEVNSNPALWDTPGVLAQVFWAHQLNFSLFLTVFVIAGHP